MFQYGFRNTHNILSDIAECFKDTEKKKTNKMVQGLCFIHSVYLHPQLNISGCKLVLMGRMLSITPERRLLLKELEFRV